MGSIRLRLCESLFPKAFAKIVSKRVGANFNQRLFKIVSPFTMVDEQRLANLHRLMQGIIQRGISGDVVECGTCNGGSASILAAAMLVDPVKRIWMYDTFEGIPPAGPLDEEMAQTQSGHFKGTQKNVEDVLGRVGFPLERAIIQKGHFAETFKVKRPTEISLLHIDADWYDSVLLSLKTFYPLMSDGGVVILDDFGHWEGARRAFYDFCQQANRQPLLERVGYTQAYWFKNREHNRGTG